MPKGVPNKRYTPEFKQKVVEAVLNEGISYREAQREYGVSADGQIQIWERIYLTEGPGGLAVERRGRSRIGRPEKLPKRIGCCSLREVLPSRSLSSLLML